MGRVLRLGLAALAAGCAPARAPSCAEAWAGVPAAERGYDWQRDPVITPRGNEGYARFARRLPRRGCAKAWTVLVYMDARAGDLEAPAERDLRSIEGPAERPAWSAASTVEADVVVQVERRDVRRLHLFRVPPGYGAEPGSAGRSPIVDPRYGVERATGVQSPIVELPGEPVAPAEESLRRFLTWGIERYPSRRYAVIVWGHGLGWQPAEGGAGGLATPGLASALGAASRRRLGGSPFDLYASDACLMQSIEVAGELTAAARYVVGSEQIEEDYVGLPYRAWLPILNGSAPAPPPPASCPPADAACAAAAALPASEDPPPSRRATLSALDEAAIAHDLVPAMRGLSAAVEGYVREDDLRRIGLQVLLGAADGPLRGTPAFRGGTRDIGLFLGRLAAEVKREPGAAGSTGAREVLAAVEEARRALGRAVIAASFGPEYHAPGYGGMAGISLWLPRDGAEYRARVGFFASSVLYHAPAGAPSFRSFLDRVFAPPAE